MLDVGERLAGVCDVELIGPAEGRARAAIEDAVADVLPRLEGAFSTVIMTNDRVVAFRDPAGLRPLVLGRLGDRYCVASESCALDIIGAKFVRDVKPGEMVSISASGIETRIVASSDREAFCVFEYIYFARPDSRMNGDVLQAARGRMGEILHRESPAPGADLVIAVPDSGNAAARGSLTPPALLAEAMLPRLSPA